MQDVTSVWMVMGGSTAEPQTVMYMLYDGEGRFKASRIKYIVWLMAEKWQPCLLICLSPSVLNIIWLKPL